MKDQPSSIVEQAWRGVLIALALAMSACAGTPPPPPPDAGPYPADYKEIMWAAIATPRLVTVTIKSAEITKPVQGQLVRQRMVLLTPVVEPTAYTGWITCTRIRVDAGLLINHDWPVLGYLINRGKIISMTFSDACQTQPFERWPEIEGRTIR